MIARQPWVEREFVFAEPAWMFPNELERLRGTPARVEDRVAGLAPERLTRRGGSFAWAHLRARGSMRRQGVDQLLDFVRGVVEVRAGPQLTPPAGQHDPELVAQVFA